MTQDELHLDFETRSEVDLTVCGQDVYVNHPSTEVIMASWSLNGSQVKVWQLPEGRFPAELSEAITSPEVSIKAFNAPFEFGIINRVLKAKTPIERFHCVMVHAYSLGFTGGLDAVGEQIGLSADKQKLASGKRLIHKFCKPRRLSAANQDKYWDWKNAKPQWDEFVEYAYRDTVAEVAVDEFCTKVWPMPDEERRLWLLDRQINERGLPIDLTLVGGALAVEKGEKHHLESQLKDCTGLENPNSVPQMLGWVEKRGITLPNLQKATVAEFLKNSNDGQSDDIRDIRKALVIRQSSAKTSTAKWSKIKTSVGEGARLRNTLQMNGAGRTGRWAGRGSQFQNAPAANVRAISPTHTGSAITELDLILGAADVLAQGDWALASALYSDVMGVLSGAIRQAVTAKKGHTLMASDLASIESVVLAWMAGCTSKLDIFIQSRDPYKVFASHYFHVSEEDVSAKQRKFSKPPELGCGYGLGAKGLIAYADGYGVKLSEDESRRMVDLYRTLYVEVVEMWHWMVQSVNQVTEFGNTCSGYKVEISRNDRFLLIKLPSGRYLFYDRPELNDVKTPWGEVRKGFTYMGKNQYTQKWGRLSTHGGKIVENLVQAVARDVLKLGIFEAVMEGFDPILLVHDELVAEVPVSDPYLTVDLLNDCLVRGAEWTKGLPLRAAGWSGKRYRKD